MAENKEVAEKKASTAVTTFDDSLLSGGTGLEETTTEDYAIPFIRVLQPMSPQLLKNEGDYLPGAEAGQLLNTVTRQTYDGEEGLSIVPCAYTKKYIEFIPREKGGGFVNSNHDISILAKCKRDENTNRFMTPDGTEIVETAQYFILVLDPEPQQAVLALSSTQLGTSRKWLTMLRMAKVQNKKGESVDAPMFAYTYRLTTTTQSNDKGSWYGFSVNQEGPTDIAVANVAKDFMSAARSGDVEVKEEQQRDEVVKTPKADSVI